MRITTVYVERFSQDGGDGSRNGITITLEEGDTYGQALALANHLLWPELYDKSYKEKGAESAEDSSPHEFLQQSDIAF